MFPELDRGRRRRSRRRLLVPIIISAVLVVAWWISSLSQDNLSSADFVQELQQIADGQATRAERFRQLYVDARVMAVRRESLSVTIDQAITEIDRDLGKIEAMTNLPVEAQRAHILIDLALSRWRRGLEGFKDAALRLPDPNEVSARHDLQAAIVDLDIGDALYADFQVEVVGLRETIGVQGAPFPDIVFIEPAMAFSESVGQLTEQLRTNPAMASLQVLEISTVGFTPEFTGATAGTGVPLLPNTDELTIEVVIRNVGTDVEEGLQLQLKLFTGAIERTSEVSPVSAINPAGGSTAVQFVSIAVDDGVTYRLELSLLQSAGVTIASYTQDFAVNPPAS
jgi:hypothetical protein